MPPDIIKQQQEVAREKWLKAENDADGNHSYDRARQREGYDYGREDFITLIRSITGISPTR